MVREPNKEVVTVVVVVVVVAVVAVVEKSTRSGKTILPFTK